MRQQIEDRAEYSVLLFQQEGALIGGHQHAVRVCTTVHTLQGLSGSSLTAGGHLS